MSEESKDCLQCRLTSGGGLLAVGAYVVHQSRKVKTFSRHIITAIGYGFGVMGGLRIFNLPPFKSQSKDQEKVQNKAGAAKIYDYNESNLNTRKVWAPLLKALQTCVTK